MKGEIIDGVLDAMIRPRPKHQAVGARITSSLEPPFRLEISPDVAGWRRQRMPELPDGTISLVDVLEWWSLLGSGGS